MRLQLIKTGFFSCEGGAMFGVIPRKSWEKRYPAIGEKCPMGMNVLLIDFGNRKVLIDTGVGLKNISGLKSYGFKSLADLSAEIIQGGIQPEDITDVVLTHLHFDHCGGCTIQGEDGELKVAFPNAAHWVSRLQWEHYLSPALLDADAYLSENVEPIVSAGLLKIIDQDTEIFDGFTLKIFGGHTPGQIVPVFKFNCATYCFAGDVVPTAAHLSPLWVSAYDIFPVDSVTEKVKLLNQVVDGDWELITPHDVYHPMVAVKKTGNFFKIRTTNSPKI